MFDSSRMILPEAIHEPRDLLFDRVEQFEFIDAPSPRMRIDTAHLGSIRLARVRSTGHRIALHEEGNISFLLPLAGRIGVETPRTSVRSAAGGALFMSPNRRTTRVMPADEPVYDAVVLLAPIDTVLPRSGQRAARANGFEVALTDADTRRPDSTLVRYLRYLADEFGRPDSPLARPLAQKAIEMQLTDLLVELSDRIFDAEANDDRRTLDAAKVRLAEALMWSRYGDPLSVNELARILEVSTRSVQLAFKAVRGTTPHAVLRSIRLTQAHRKLAAPNDRTTVTDVALTCGFTHFGRFAADYCRRFGETPLQTLKAARGR